MEHKEDEQVEQMATGEEEEEDSPLNRLENYCIPIVSSAGKDAPDRTGLQLFLLGRGPYDPPIPIGRIRGKAWVCGGCLFLNPARNPKCKHVLVCQHVKTMQAAKAKNITMYEGDYFPEHIDDITHLLLALTDAYLDYAESKSMAMRTLMRKRFMVKPGAEAEVISRGRRVWEGVLKPFEELQSMMDETERNNALWQAHVNLMTTHVNASDEDTFCAMFYAALGNREKWAEQYVGYANYSVAQMAFYDNLFALRKESPHVEEVFNSFLEYNKMYNRQVCLKEEA